MHATTGVDEVLAGAGGIFAFAMVNP